MADIRINALATTATTPASDDYLALDGTAQGTRKILATNIANNVTDVILGASGPSVKSSLSARAPRQGLVFDGTAGATANVGTIGSSPVSFGGRCTIPASGTNVLFAISASATTPAQPKALAIYTFGTSLYVQLNAAIGNYLLSEVSGFVTTYAGKVVDILAVRSTSGNIALYVNGVATSPSFSSVGGSAPANWQADIDGPYALLGITSVSAWVAGTFYPPVCYNRALSASEVVSLYEAGAPAGADYNNATNTSLITGDNSTFASDTGYWTLAAGATISGGNLNLAGNGSRADRTLPLSVGKKYRAVAVVTANTATDLILGSSTGGSYAILSGTGTLTGEFVASSTSFTIYQNGAGAITVDSITLVPIGLLLAPDAAQAGGGLVWYDTSGNAANITLPASGVSWNVPSSRVLGGNWTTSGNLTVSGTGQSSIAGNLKVNNQDSAGDPTALGALQLFATANSATGAGGVEWKADAGGSGYGYRKLTVFDGSSAYDLYTQSRSNSASWTTRLVLKSNGNYLIGTTTDTGQKLQVNGTALLGTDNASLGAYFDYNGGISGNATLWLKQTTKSSSTYTLTGGGTYTALNAPSGGSIYLRINNSDALTLDSSQNATFAGDVFSTKSINIASGYSLTAQDSGNTYRTILRGIADNTVEIGWGTATPTNGHLIFKAGGTEQGRINPAGGWILGLTASAPVLGTNSTMTFELTSNTSLTIKVRGTDGTTRSATLTLS